MPLNGPPSGTVAYCILFMSWFLPGLSDFHNHLTHSALSKSQSFRSESRAFNKNLGRQAVGHADHPRFDFVSDFEPGISARPARNDNGDRKSLLGSMIGAGRGAGKKKSEKQ